MTSAGWDQSILASSTVIFERIADAGVGLRPLDKTASLDAVQSVHKQPGTADRQPAQQLPGGVFRADLLGGVARIGPASRSSTIRKVVAPVVSSPARTACCTGAAPRQAGSSEKCRFTQPLAGMSSTRCGNKAP